MKKFTALVMILMMTNTCNVFATPQGLDFENPFRMFKKAALILLVASTNALEGPKNSNVNCPTLTGPFLTTCNNTGILVTQGNYVDLCKYGYTCRDNEGDRVRSTVTMPTGNFVIDGVDNINGSPAVPLNRNARVPLTGGVLSQEDHQLLCNKAVDGTFKKTCKIQSSENINDNGVYLCKLTGRCEDELGKEKKIKNVLLTPGVYGIINENIENCGSYLVYSTADYCQYNENRKEIINSGVGVHTGPLNSVGRQIALT